VVEAKSDSTAVDIVAIPFGAGLNAPLEFTATETTPLTPQSAVAAVPAPAPARTAPRPAPQTSGTATPTIEDALYRAGDTLINTLPDNITIAILSVSTRERDLAEFVIDEIAYVLVNSGNFKIVDRKSLDSIRSEQNFQMSGEVDDESAVSIGKLLGANVVITGSIGGADSMRRLRLKALDVKTAEIVAMASERY
jgi:hypothetical protein